MKRNKTKEQRNESQQLHHPHPLQIYQNSTVTDFNRDRAIEPMTTSLKSDKTFLYFEVNNTIEKVNVTVFVL